LSLVPIPAEVIPCKKGLLADEKARYVALHASSYLLEEAFLV
jgi:hypothetical protein